MDVVAQLEGVVNLLFGVLGPFILVLGIVVFVHEYGHYIVGRWCGIHADAFSIGFGPEIVGWEDKRGTRWRLAWIPLGGYVMFRGDADPSSISTDNDAIAKLTPVERRATMAGAPLWARAATIIAGPMANFLLSIVLVIFVLLAFEQPSDKPVLGAVAEDGQAYALGLRTGDAVKAVDGQAVTTFSAFQEAVLLEPGSSHVVTVERDGAERDLEIGFTRSPVIASVRRSSPAHRACLKPGDRITAVNGAPVTAFEQLQSAVLSSEGEALTVTIARDDEASERVVEIIPERLEHMNLETQEVEQRLLIGVSANFNLGMQRSLAPVPAGDAISRGLTFPLINIQATLSYLHAWAFGAGDGSSLGGPIGIARMSGQAVGAGLTGFILFIATISTAIGLMNLFPIPILDGGHLVLYAIEAVRGKPLGQRAMEIISTVGFMAILALMIFATTNDLSGVVTDFASDC